MRDAGSTGSIESIGNTRSIRESITSSPQGSARRSRSSIERRAGHRPLRRSSVALALCRLEREHVALLLAICELESPNEVDGNSLALREALLPLLREDLRQTQRALARAAQGHYGICEDCNRPLSAHLLELKPSATTCPACEAREARARRATVD